MKLQYRALGCTAGMGNEGDVLAKGKPSGVGKFGKGKAKGKGKFKGKGKGKFKGKVKGKRKACQDMVGPPNDVMEISDDDSLSARPHENKVHRGTQTKV